MLTKEIIISFSNLRKCREDSFSFVFDIWLPRKRTVAYESCNLEHEYFANFSEWSRVNVNCFIRLAIPVRMLIFNCIIAAQIENSKILPSVCAGKLALFVLRGRSLLERKLKDQ
ncbi:MAG: hypothetical protein DKT66_11505 [Candidatus Melainabacteria bacterium]|nr:MAG: hypothetical protein DKT66_11505 [Candidatus Melainabacteria bacterium]